MNDKQLKEQIKHLEEIVNSYHVEQSGGLVNGTISVSGDFSKINQLKKEYEEKYKTPDLDAVLREKWTELGRVYCDYGKTIVPFAEITFIKAKELGLFTHLLEKFADEAIEYFGNKFKEYTENEVVNKLNKLKAKYTNTKETL